MADQVPFHESGQQQVYGIDEMCLYNDHPLCRNPRCGCSCHKAARVEADHNGVSRVVAPQSSPASIQTGLDKYCPACKKKAASDQNYCKVDGNKLSSLRCPECGTPGDQEDNYCGYCGSSMKASDHELEMAATGSGIAEDSPIPPVSEVITEDAEVAMRVAMAKKTVPAPVRPAVNQRMFK